jgi:hypothetical protein
MRCCLRALSQSLAVERIVLSRHLDIAYEGACMSCLRSLAETVRMCHIPGLSEDRACASCPSRPSLVLGNLADSIPHGWGGVAPRVKPWQARAKCHSCASQVNDAASAVAARLLALEREVSREAFMVIGESGHA